MTLPKLSLFPASHDDGLAMLSAFELVSGGVFEFLQSEGAEVGQGMALEPGPEKFDRIEFRRIGRQTLNDDPAIGRIDVVAHQRAAMRPGAVPQDQQPPAMMEERRCADLSLERAP